MQPHQNPYGQPPTFQPSFQPQQPHQPMVYGQPQPQQHAMVYGNMHQHQQQQQRPMPVFSQPPMPVFSQPPPYAAAPAQQPGGANMNALLAEARALQSQQHSVPPSGLQQAPVTFGQLAEARVQQQQQMQMQQQQQQQMAYQQPAAFAAFPAPSPPPLQQQQQQQQPQFSPFAFNQPVPVAAQTALGPVKGAHVSSFQPAAPPAASQGRVLPPPPPAASAAAVSTPVGGGPRGPGATVTAPQQSMAVAPPPVATAAAVRPPPERKQQEMELQRQKDEVKRLEEARMRQMDEARVRMQHEQQRLEAAKRDEEARLRQAEQDARQRIEGHKREEEAKLREKQERMEREMEQQRRQLQLEAEQAEQRRRELEARETELSRQAQRERAALDSQRALAAKQTRQEALSKDALRQEISLANQRVAQLEAELERETHARTAAEKRCAALARAAADTGNNAANNAANNSAANARALSVVISEASDLLDMYSDCFAQLTASVISAGANERIAKEATRAAVAVIKKHGSDAAKQELTADLKAARDGHEQIMETARNEYKKQPQASLLSRMEMKKLEALNRWNGLVDAPAAVTPPNKAARNGPAIDDRRAPPPIHRPAPAVVESSPEVVVEELQAPKQLRVASPPSQRPRTDTGSASKPRAAMPPAATDLFGGASSPPTEAPSYTSPTSGGGGIGKSERERIQEALDSKAAMNRAMQMQYASQNSMSASGRAAADDHSNGSSNVDVAKQKATEALQKLKGAMGKAADKLKQAVAKKGGGGYSDAAGDDFEISAPSNFQHASHLERERGRDGRDDDLFDQVQFAATEPSVGPVEVSHFAEEYRP